MADNRSGGVWWLDDGPSSADGGGAEGGAEDGVYRPDTPAAAELPEARTLRRGSADPAVSPGRTDVTSRYPGWTSVVFEFPSDEPEPQPVPVAAAPPLPEQRAVEEPADETAAPGAAVAAAAGALAGRKPSPLLLLAALALLAGALTGQLLAMLGGWGAAYLSRRLGDFTKKFVVLGIPLITMTASSVWFWGRAQGRWGTPLAQGTALSHATWSAAPDVLRIAAVLSALVLLAITLRRRPQA